MTSNRRYDVLRPLSCATIALAIAACQQPAASAAEGKGGQQPKRSTPAKAWAKPTIHLEKNGMIWADGWQKGPDGRYSAALRDSAAPMMLDHAQPGPVDGASAFSAALKAARIDNIRDAKTFQMTSYGDLAGTEGKAGWASGATAIVGGVEQALFAVTAFNDKRGGYDTTLFMTPLETLRKWGGVKFYTDAMNFTRHLDFVPSKIWDDGAQANPRQQAELYAAMVDMIFNRLFAEGIGISAATMQMMNNINRDQNTELNCWRSSGCTYVPGAAPGQGQAVQK